jgi:sugar phosphate permease
MAAPQAAPQSKYRWTILGAGVVAQASASAIGLGLPAIAPEIRHGYGLTLPQVGVVLAALNFGLILTLLPWGLVADRIGERAVLASGLTGCAAALLVAANTSSYPGLVAALAVAGAFGGGTQSASGRAVMSWFSPEERGLALGIRQTAVPLGGAIAAGVLPALTNISLRSAFYGLAIGCFAAALVGAALLRTEPGDELSELTRPLRDRRVWLLCLASTFYVTTQISLLGFVVLFLHDDRGLSTATAAGVLALLQIGGGVARIVVGRLSDRMQARVVPLRAVALLLTGSLALATALLHASLWLLLPTLVIAGTLAMSWNGLSFTAAAELAGRARSGAAIGLQQTWLSAGSIVAPIAFAALVHTWSWRVAFAVAAASPVVGYALLSPVSERRS